MAENVVMLLHSVFPVPFLFREIYFKDIFHLSGSPRHTQAHMQYTVYKICTFDPLRSQDLHDLHLHPNRSAVYRYQLVIFTS